MSGLVLLTASLTPIFLPVMKKLAALSLALVSAASVAQAQDAGGFRIGLKVGGTYSNISGDNVSQIT
ncbi:hypothetical protein, partial [Enterobacter asburiae]|uniref:hypothetical protein n=1 Tax=Enterobacter asburiae TaxID=61645 RepID=UPI003896E76D